MRWTTQQDMFVVAITRDEVTVEVGYFGEQKIANKFAESIQTTLMIGAPSTYSVTTVEVIPPAFAVGQFVTMRSDFRHEYNALGPDFDGNPRQYIEPDDFGVVIESFAPQYGRNVFIPRLGITVNLRKYDLDPVDVEVQK